MQITCCASFGWCEMVRAPGTEIQGAAALGMSFGDVLTVIGSLSMADFRKSMTTHADHTIWQDVYTPKTPAGDVYRKLTVVDDVLVVSFKKL
jgi:motility quorum-sensing regulator/GCU-specific mRNA interferase toxin